MWKKLRSALHERVHGAKVLRHERKSAEEQQSTINERDVISASCSSCGSDHGEYESKHSSARASVRPCLGVEFIVSSVADIVSSDSVPYYFYVCIGEIGASGSQKRRRHLQTSGILSGKWPSLTDDQSHYLMSIDRLQQPEITLRFSRSSIIGQDKYLGEYRINISSYPPAISEDYHQHAFQVGTHGMVSCKWRVVTYDPSWGKSTRRLSYILPRDSSAHIVSESEKLGGLVETVRKSLKSFDNHKENEDSRNSSIGMETWLVTLLSTLELRELEGIVLHVSLVELLRRVRLSADIISQRSSGYPPSAFSIEARTRVIKAVVVISRSERSPSENKSGNIWVDPQSTVHDLIAGCPVEYLALLRSSLDKGGDSIDLFGIVYKFLADDWQTKVIALIRRSTATSEFPIHIMSEVDQVVFSPFGSTVWWPEGPIPGFKILFDALSDEVTFASNKPNNSFATSIMRREVRLAGMAGCPVIFDDNIEERITKKQDSWNMYRRLFPGTRFLWFTENPEFAKRIMQDEIDGMSSGDQTGKVCTTFVMAPRHSSLHITTGPILIDTGVVSCTNYIQAAIACFDRRYISEDCLANKVIPEFTTMIDNLMHEDRRKSRYRLKERIVELKIDLEKLRSKLSGNPAVYEASYMSKNSSETQLENQRYTYSLASKSSHDQSVASSPKLRIYN